MKNTLLVLALLGAPALSAVEAAAAIKSELVTYQDGDATLEGYLVYDDSIKEARPGVLVFHEWWGLGDYVKRRADQLAELGYVAFAPDMYGKGVYAKDHTQAEKLMNPIKNDRKALRKRAHAGLEQLKKQKAVDSGKLAAIGYCFGGTTALEMARAGEDLKAVASFHGDLTTAEPKKTLLVKPSILILQGGDDQWTLSGIGPFQEEMRGAGADYQINVYSGAVHSFTVKEAGNNPKAGMAYNAKADARSWQELQDFFKETLK